MYKNSNSFIALMSGSKIFLQQVLALLAKDLKTEWRTREIFTSMFVFAVLVVVVFNFAIGADTELIRQVASGVIWIALSFASVLGLQRTGRWKVKKIACKVSFWRYMIAVRFLLLKCLQDAVFTGVSDRYIASLRYMVSY